MGRLAILVLAFMGLLLLRADAQHGRRVALVIGNATYEAAGPLANPVNDAVDIAAKLRQIGFEVVEGHDLGKRELERRIGEFSDLLPGAEVGMLFYAGHGIQVDGRNYIVPVDARLDVPAKLRLEAVPMDDVIDIIEQQATTSLVFLDACRNNPFTRSLGTSGRAARPLSGGLARFDSTRGSFIAFSTAPDAVAMDGSGRNSPFASALVRHLDIPGQSINDLMIAVRRDVIAETNGFQRPWEQGSLVQRFEFVPADGPPAPAPPPAAALPAPPQEQVASAERSVVDEAGIHALIAEYLKPDPATMRDKVLAMYTETATLWGTPYDINTVVDMKTEFFAYYKAWEIELTPGTTKIRKRGQKRADVTFDMYYAYEPKDPSVVPPRGDARVVLGLVRDENGWRIESESSEEMP